MRLYLVGDDFRAFNGFIADRYEEDPEPAKAFLSAPFDGGTGPVSAVNVEMNLRRFAARYYSAHPQYRQAWAPLW